jgi:peroxiredoxin
MASASSALDGFIKELRATGIEERAKRVGDAAPDVGLPDASGRVVRLSDLWKPGPLVVVFYRGGWCSYCSEELRSWQGRLEALRAVGAQIVAISLESPDHALSTSERNRVAFPVLSDVALQAANGFDIAFTLPAELIDLYGAAGDTQPVLNASGEWVVPVPATFVVDSRGIIRFADVDLDFRRRADPSDVLRVAAGSIVDDAGVVQVSVS